MSQSFDLVAAIRKRPGMFIGDPDDGGVLRWTEGFIHLQSGVSRSQIAVSLHKGDFISFNRGADGAREFEALIKELDNEDFSDSPRGDLDWIICFATSADFRATSRLNGIERRLRAKEGSIVSDVRTPTDRAPGLKVRAKPDPTIFTTFSGFDRNRTYATLRNRALLNPGLSIMLKDMRHSPPIRLEATFPNGFRDVLAQPFRLPHFSCDETQVIDLEGETQGTTLSGAIRFDSSNDRTLVTFVNGISVTRGEHIRGFVDALKLLRVENLDPGGHTAFLSLQMDAPSFAAPVKDNLVNDGVRKFVAESILRSVRSLTQPD